MPNPNLYNEIQKLQERMNEITRLVEEIKEPIKERRETEFQNKPIFIANINGLFHTVSVIPTHTPRNFKEQIVLVDSNGGTKKLYVYFNNSWKFTRFYNT